MKSLTRAYETRDIADFLHNAFPPQWAGIAARIIESGATIADTSAWAPRWSPIPPTVKQHNPRVYGSHGDPVRTGMLKSVVYRVHDCIHQLWGLPTPQSFSDDDFYVFKRAVMCGEVAVLTLTELVYCEHLWETVPELREVLALRNGVPMKRACFQHLTVQEMAARLDGLLHKKIRPRWCRENIHATAFANDYVPMLESDRALADRHWTLMKEHAWQPLAAPNARYSPDLDGLELTTWMINDFMHQMRTDPVVDVGLRDYNRKRRALISLPQGW